MTVQRFEATPESVAQVRRFVADTLSATTVGLDELVDDVVLMASELATNAVRHAATPYTVEIVETTDDIRVIVTDLGGGNPVRKSPAQTEISGRGIVIIEALSSEWGVDASPHATSVWFRVHRRPVSPESTPNARPLR